MVRLRRRVVCLDAVWLRLEIHDDNCGLAIAKVEREQWISVGYAGRERVWAYMERKWNDQPVRRNSPAGLSMKINGRLSQEVLDLYFGRDVE